MALNSNALVTLNELGNFIGHTEVAKLSGSYEAYINSASEYIETEANQSFFSGSVETEIFSGKGYAPNIPAFHSLHPLNHAPVSITPVLRLYNWDGSSWNEVNAITYAVDTVAGTVYFPGISTAYNTQLGYVGEFGNYFIKGESNYKAEYYFGYDGVTNIPFDLKQACAMIVAFFKHRGKHMGMSSQDDKTYDNDVPATATTIINKYTR